jgi:hypothetical protein
MPRKSERIRDPVHNLIEFDRTDGFEAAMWGIVESPPFQRLRRIKQLGFSDFVYPGATHSRFAHSLGVFHTARRLMGIVRGHLGADYDERRGRVALAATLVHDLGHGPFSHAFQRVTEEVAMGCDEHELISRDIVAALAPQLDGALGSGFAAEVGALIAGSAHSRGSGPRSVYDAVVSSQFDADRLDYVRRDRIMAGSLHGTIDFEWLMANLEIGHVRVEGGEEAPTFVVRHKAVHAAEAYVVGLFQLYPTIYYHKGTRNAEVIFVELMKRVFTAIRSGDADAVGLPTGHPLVRYAEAPREPAHFLALDDAVVWGSLWQLCAGRDLVVADLAGRLLDRRLLRCFDVREEVQRRLPHGLSPQETEARIDAVADALAGEVAASRPADGPLLLHDRYQRSPYEMVAGEESPLNQILVADSGGRIVDLGELSPIVRAVRPFKVDRYYFDRADSGSAALLERLLGAAL